MTKITKTNTAARAKASAVPKAVSAIKQPTRLAQLEQLLVRPEGASIAEMSEATGWQSHSIRGAMAGGLKRKGLVITSVKVDDTRRYHGARPA